MSTLIPSLCSSVVIPIVRSVEFDPQYRSIPPVPGGGTTPADFIVRNNDEWSVLSTAQLSGKVVEFQGTDFDQVVVADHPFAEGVTLRCADASSKIPSIMFGGTVGDVTFDGLNIQGRGWPFENHLIVNNGTVGTLHSRNSSFRHGYGQDLVDVVTDVDRPEYERIDNNLVGTTASTAHALTWKDPARNGGWIEFFNNGSETVYPQTGDGGVTVAVGGGYNFGNAQNPKFGVDPGERGRINGLDPTVDTHIAIVTASGTSNVNARTEIGLSKYQANLFFSTGIGRFKNLIFRQNTVSDVNNGFKSIYVEEEAIAFRNLVRRIYQDIFSGFFGQNRTRVILNAYGLPYARSGIAQELNGDAGDPHGDANQAFSTGDFQIENVIEALSVPIYEPVRAGALSQGLLFSDNNHDPSYGKIYAIGNVRPGGAPVGLVVGEIDGGNPYPHTGVYVFGETIFNYQTPAVGASNIKTVTAADAVTYVANSIYTGLSETGEGEQVVKDSYNGFQVADLTSYLPFVQQWETATNTAERRAAFSTAGGLAAGAGLDALGLAANWDAQSEDDALNWNHLPTGVAWNDVKGAPTGTQYVFPLRTNMNLLDSVSVAPDNGVEWRSVDENGTEVQAWTSGNGTLDRYHQIQTRVMSANGALTDVEMGITLNGYRETAKVTTALSLKDTFDPNGAYWADTANMPANTTVIEWEAALMYPATFPSQHYPFWAIGNARLIVAGSAGRMLIEVEDAAETVQLYFDSGDVTPPKDKPTILNFKVDFESLRAIASIDGVEVINQPINDSPGNNHFQTNRKVGFGGNGVQILSGSEIEYLKVWFTTDSTRALRKEISVAALGSIAAINADPWTTGTVVAV